MNHELVQRILARAQVGNKDISWREFVDAAHHALAVNGIGLTPREVFILEGANKWFRKHAIELGLDPDAPPSDVKSDWID